MFLWPARPLAKLFRIVIVIYKQDDKIMQKATKAPRAPWIPMEKVISATRACWLLMSALFTDH